MNILKPPCKEKCSPLDTSMWGRSYKWARRTGPCAEEAVHDLSNRSETITKMDKKVPKTMQRHGY